MAHGLMEMGEGGLRCGRLCGDWTVMARHDGLVFMFVG